MEDNFTTATPTAYAGFWIRVGAYILDWIILMILNAIIYFIYSFIGNPDQRYTWEAGAYTSVANIISFLVTWIYFASLESSKFQGTLGKQMVGILVTDEAGNRISFLRATGRHFAKFLSAIILLIGFIMAAFTAKKQALHDILAKTLVLKKAVVPE